MTDVVILLLTGSAGGVIGIFFFGGLWWTVRRSVASEHPARWLLVSFFLRMGISMVGFYLVSSGHWQRLLACLLGFVIARVGVVWFFRKPAEPGRSQSQEASHAP